MQQELHVGVQDYSISPFNVYREYVILGARLLVRLCSHLTAAPAKPMIACGSPCDKTLHLSYAQHVNHGHEPVCDIARQNVCQCGRESGVVL